MKKTMEQIMQALEESRIEAVKIARFHRTPIVTEQNGKAERVDPFTIPIPEDALPNRINLNGDL